MVARPGDEEREAIIEALRDAMEAYRIAPTDGSGVDRGMELWTAIYRLEQAARASVPASADDDSIPAKAYCCRCGKRPLDDGAELTCGCWTCSSECWDAEVGKIGAPAPHRCPTTINAQPWGREKLAEAMKGEARAVVGHAVFDDECWTRFATVALSRPLPSQPVGEKGVCVAEGRVEILGREATVGNHPGPRVAIFRLPSVTQGLVTALDGKPVSVVLVERVESKPSESKEPK